MFLEVKNLEKSYGDKKVIDNLSFSVDKGKMLCLLGPSGCGKTTILRTLGGFITYKGRIILDGQDISDLAPEDRNVTTVFQSFGLFPHMNVIENVSYGLKFRDIDKESARSMAKEMIEKVGLKGYETRSIGKLSGGEKQRVALARSLVIEPKLLLLDEPLSSLDAKLRQKMRGEIKRIQRDLGVTAIFVTHDQAEAFELADEIILLNKGRIMQQDSAFNLYNKPQNTFALDFIGKHTELDGGYVRPEKVDIVKEGEPARVEKILFQGQTIDLVLNTGKEKVLASLLNKDFSLKEGDIVNIVFNKERIGDNSNLA